RLLQRGRPARHQLQSLPVLGFGLSGAPRPGRECECRGHPAHQAGERGLGAGYLCQRTHRAESGLAPMMQPLKGDRLLAAWDRGAQQSDLNRAVTLLAVASQDRSEERLASLSIPERNLMLLDLHRISFGDTLHGYLPCPSCGTRLEFVVPVSPLIDRLEAARPRGN